MLDSLQKSRRTLLGALPAEEDIPMFPLRIAENRPGEEEECREHAEYCTVSLVGFWSYHLQ